MHPTTKITKLDLYFTTRAHGDTFTIYTRGWKLAMLLNFLNHLQKQYYRSENGQDLAEYSLLIGLIALLVVVSLTIIGGSISTIFNAIAVALQIGV